MDYKVRYFVEEDFEAVLEVWQQTDLGDVIRGDNLSIINETIKNGGALFLLIVDDVIIGTSWITNDSRRLYLHHLGIIPKFQGKGLSKLLMEKSMQFASESKLQIKLEVHKNSRIARYIYEKYGFKYLGDYDVFIVREY